MATPNVSALEKTANLSLADHALHGHNAANDKKTAAVTAANETDEPLQKPDGAAVIDPEQPAGLQKMEAVTLVWTKKWLITAYLL